MLKKENLILLNGIAVLALVLSACGESVTQDPSISTAVALTVAAKNTQQAEPTLPPVITPTTTLAVAPPLTPVSTRVPPTLPVSNGNSACLKANYVNETIPDGTIMTPGLQFTKTWQILNSSPCTWDTSYKIIYWDGNVMGGAYVYNFPQAVGPGKIVDISLVLTAPADDGIYESYWMFQAPDGTAFGVGQYNKPIFAKIEVSTAKHPGYTITKVDYEIVREPPTGCPANTRWTVYATVTTNGPFEFSYYWSQKDGNDSTPKKAEIEAAGSKTFEREWVVGLANTAGEKWIEFNVVDPFEKSYGRAVFTHTCSQ
jgi:hypothetical protein